MRCVQDSNSSVCVCVCVRYTLFLAEICLFRVSVFRNKKRCHELFQLYIRVRFLWMNPAVDKSTVKRPPEAVTHMMNSLIFYLQSFYTHSIIAHGREIKSSFNMLEYVGHMQSEIVIMVLSCNSRPL